MSISGKKSSASNGRHQRRDTRLLRVPAPKVPPGSDGDGFFSDKAWAGIAKKLGLSPREADIARCLPAGLGDRQIARKLDVSLNTIQGHMKRLYGKLAIHSRAEVVGCILLAQHALRTKPPRSSPR